MSEPRDDAETLDAMFGAELATTFQAMKALDDAEWVTMRLMIRPHAVDEMVRARASLDEGLPRSPTPEDLIALRTLLAIFDPVIAEAGAVLSERVSRERHPSGGSNGE